MRDEDRLSTLPRIIACELLQLHSLSRHIWYPLPGNVSNLNILDMKRAYSTASLTGYLFVLAPYCFPSQKPSANTESGRSCSIRFFLSLFVFKPFSCSVWGREVATQVLVLSRHAAAAGCRIHSEGDR